MWEKGKVVTEYKGVNSAVSWRELEKQTSRQKESLKRWHDLYLKHPNYDQYLLITEQRCGAWWSNFDQPYLAQD